MRSTDSRSCGPQSQRAEPNTSPVRHSECIRTSGVRPGHIFPLRARPGGVLVRTGQTEGSVDLARLAGLNPAGVICEVMNDDGTMARRPDLEKFSAQHGLMILSVADIIKYRMERERLVRRAAEAPLPTMYGEMRAIAYENDVDAKQHVALVKGAWAADEPVLVRVHSKCLTGDVFGSARCDCGPQLRESVERIAAAGGYLLYLRQEGRGIGLYNKLDAYALQDAGLDTYQANVALGLPEDARDYTAAAQMLTALGVDSVHLLSNNPDKEAQLAGLHVTVAERVPTGAHATAHNLRYLRAKVEHTRHSITLDGVLSVA